MKKIGWICLAVVFAALAGCADAGPEVDAVKFDAVKTVTVVYSGKNNYAVGAAGVPLIIPGAGLAAAAVAGVATGAANAGANNTNKKAVTFGELVKAKLGDTNLDRRFTDGIEASLRAHGYVVTEVDANTPSLPKFTQDNHAQWHAEGPPYTETDAILLVRVFPTYQSPGPLNSYSRMVYGEIDMFKGDTHEALFRKRVYWQKFNDPYSYFTYASILDDLPRAVKGLDEGELAVVEKFDKALTAGQH